LWDQVSFDDDSALTVLEVTAITFSFFGVIIFPDILIQKWRFRNKVCRKQNIILLVGDELDNYTIITKWGMVTNLTEYKPKKSIKYVSVEKVEYEAENLKALLEGNLLAAVIPSVKIKYTLKNYSEFPYIQFTRWYSKLYVTIRKGVGNQSESEFLLFIHILRSKQIMQRFSKLIWIPKNMHFTSSEWKSNLLDPLSTRLKLVTDII
jgi:hypothetical protein